MLNSFLIILQRYTKYLNCPVLFPPFFSVESTSFPSIPFLLPTPLFLPLFLSLSSLQQSLANQLLTILYSFSHFITMHYLSYYNSSKNTTHNLFQNANMKEEGKELIILHHKILNSGHCTFLRARRRWSAII